MRYTLCVIHYIYKYNQKQYVFANTPKTNSNATLNFIKSFKKQS